MKTTEEVHVVVTLPPGKEPWNSLFRTLCGPPRWSSSVGEEVNFFLYRESKSILATHCTDGAIPAVKEEI
jgi:hypothetical protein